MPRLLEQLLADAESPSATRSLLDSSSYGIAREFRNGVREMGLHDAVDVDDRTTVMVFDKLDRRRGEIISIEKREPVWLLIEWRDGEDEPANCFLCLLPERMTKKKLVRMVIQCWQCW